ncbi:MAG: hypothetical protein EAX86_02725 [Candidatus Heimdallarchaeota archaeon]|nr:hypothetical protein [Candidatus Heimdallarchaeota archaeon]
MTAHSRRNKYGRTEIDIATKYFEEEKERTKKLLEKKKRQYASKSDEKSYSEIQSSEIIVEKKNRKTPIKNYSELPDSPKKQKKFSFRKNSQKLKPTKRRTIMKKGQKKRVKKSRMQFFQRYNI